MPEQRTRTAHRPLIAGLAVLAGLAVGTAALAASSDTQHLATLRLSRADTAEAAKIAAGADSAISAMPMMGQTTWKHTGTWPTLTTEAPVHRLVGDQLDASEAQRIAAALGVIGTATATPQSPAGSWQVTAGGGSEARTVLIFHSPGGNEVSLYSGGPVLLGEEGTKSSVAPDGTTGSDAASGSAGSSGGVTDPAGPAPTPVQPPADLPSADEAERIARDLVQNIGAGDDWAVTVSDGSVSTTACATISDAPATPQDCTDTTTAAIVTDRFVTLTRVVDGTPVDGFAWYVDVADRGVVTSVSGTLARLEPLGVYPLQPVETAYADLVAGKSPYGGIAVPMTKAAAVDAMPCRIDPQDPKGGCLDGPESTVTVTDAEVGLQRFWGSTDEGGDSGSLIVPGYTFRGSITTRWSGDSSDTTSPWSTTVVAVDPQYLGPEEPATTTTTGEPRPEPVEPMPTPEPQPAPVPEPQPAPIPEPAPAPTPSVDPNGTVTTVPAEASPGSGAVGGGAVSGG